MKSADGTPSTYHQILLLFSQAFKALEKKVSSDEIEYLGGLIYQVMSSPERLYHRPDHVLDLSREATHPIASLAILFHDLVYVQVDTLIHPLLLHYLEEFKVESGYKVTLGSVQEFKLVANLFEMKKGQTLTPPTSLNEFLSAVVASRVLKRYLTPWEIAQIACCIEATIPFRTADSQGMTSSDHLFDRLKAVNKSFGLKKSETDLAEAIQLSIEVSNRDVGGFASENTGYFVSQTWNMIMEGNPIFRNHLYTVRQYREALQRIRGFHNSLPIDRIFKQFRGFPSDSKLADLCSQATENRKIQDEYLQVSLLALGVLEAISQLTGGDAPYMLFMGDPAHEISEIEKKLGLPKSRADKNQVVRSLLRYGRTQSSPFDFKNSPLADFFYESLNKEDLGSALQRNEEFLDSKITPMQFLKSLKKVTLKSILKATSELAISRKEKILQLTKDILD